ncbi:MAG: hypothetical protein ACK5LP_01965 [Campylobacteraceae bacterium]
MSSVAKAYGVTNGGIQYAFKDKEGLLVAVI